MKPLPEFVTKGYYEKVYENPFDRKPLPKNWLGYRPKKDAPKWAWDEFNAILEQERQQQKQVEQNVPVLI